MVTDYLLYHRLILDFIHQNTVYVSYLKEATKHLANTLSKKPTRAMPWNITMEIGPSLSINVQSFLLVRKNTSTELKTALEKNISKLAKLKVIVTSSQSAADSSTALALENRSQNGAGAASSNAVVKSYGSQNEAEIPDGKDLVYSSQVVKRETTWRQTDGTEVDADEIIEAYMYGERLVSLDGTDI